MDPVLQNWYHENKCENLKTEKIIIANEGKFFSVVHKLLTYLAVFPCEGLVGSVARAQTCVVGLICRFCAYTTILARPT